jgi:hypothetical protein
VTYGVSATGGNPEAGRREADFYSTPEDATEAASYGIPGLDKMTGVWECACGDGRLAKVLEKRRPGWKMAATDLFDRSYGVGGVDFLTAEWPDDLDKDSTVIFTNPPFSLSEQFIRRALSHDVAMVVMFSKSTYYHADVRRSFFEEMAPQYKYDLTFRVDFSGQGRPTMECSWLVWVRDADDPNICQLRLLPRSPLMPSRKLALTDEDWDIL